jgi:hypothetical protein
MHYSIVEVLEWDQVAFVVGNYRWEIGIQFKFGTTLVGFNSSFASHLVPAALNRARNICSTVMEPIEEPYYFQQLFTPNPNYPHFTI